ncbi:imidazolonepropionase [uncultured Azohydromonas sp.]|uniref:imidazolonepropionase n=1 Tax=uncultured Azohydromonas sp. TaxID=487342 RepID=UPI00260AE43E|nr:imidazolonepropionase [uncultured Azohydromonas sp.]
MMNITPAWDALWLNVHLLPLTPADPAATVRDGALAVRDGRIAWLGPRAALPEGVAAASTHDGGGAWLLPGFIDCHTHVVHAGQRSEEFELRMSGQSYEAIARRGGGILNTVRATRAASEEALLAQSLPRVRNLMREGVTTLEVKSGYGLESETEARMLRVARRLGREFQLRVKASFLGAHALPPEYAGRADDYVALLCDDMLPALAAQGLVDAVDAFCEGIAFSAAQVERLFETARQLRLPVKLHAGQLSDLGGAELVGRFGGLSADHLEEVSEAGIAALRAAGSVAVLLPGAIHFLRETRRPPVEKLHAAGVPVALATDCNPGSSPMPSILAALNLGCLLLGLTPTEALAGATCHAAAALGLSTETGSLEIGKAADFALWEVERPAQLCATLGFNPCRQVVYQGRSRPLPG